MEPTVVFLTIAPELFGNIHSTPWAGPGAWAGPAGPGCTPYLYSILIYTLAPLRPGKAEGGEDGSARDWSSYRDKGSKQDWGSTRD